MRTEIYEVHKPSNQDNWWFKARKEIVEQCIRRHAMNYYEENILGNPRELDILEVGVGYGIMTEMLKEYGRVSAIEPCYDAAQYIKRNLDIPIYCCTLDKFNSNYKYDIITAFDVIEHIQNETEAIRKILTMLKDKGLLILTVPAYKFLWSEHDNLNGHYRRYTKEYFNWLYKGAINNPFTLKRITYFNTLLFPLALLDKLMLSKNKQSSALNPNKVVNTILYNIFKLEKILLKFFNLPYGVSLLLILEKK